MTLAPGQSYSQTATWSGLPTSGPLSSLAAPFSVSNNFDPNADTATFQYMAPATDVLATSVTTDQSVYQLGQPISLNFTETNVGTTPVQVLEGLSSFDIKQNGAEIWNSFFPSTFPEASPAQSYQWVTLQPGQSFTQTATWNGVPDHLPAGDSSGTFTVSNELDPRAETATFQIVAPATSSLTVSVTTNKSVYDFDEPVQLSFSETDSGNQPIAVLTGPTAFEITSNGTQVWESTDVDTLPASTSWQTLQPGQSYSQTITWDGFDGYSAASPNGTGTFTVSNLLDPTQSSVSFQVVGTPVSTPPNPGPGPVPPVPAPKPVPPISIVSPSPIAVTVSTAHDTYTVGQSVPLTVVLTNVTSSNISVSKRQTVETVTVRQGSTLVYESARKVRLPRSATIKPGQPVKLSTVWSGKTNQAGVKKATSGFYTIEVQDDGYSASTVVQLVARHKK
jgi:hypothetical protein